MAKRPGSLVLTFSKKNIDIRKLLENRKLENETFIVTDYICEAIRFYEKNKEHFEVSSMDTVKKLIDERLNAFIKINNTVTYGLVETQESVKEDTRKKEDENAMSVLEMNLDDVPIDED